MAVPISTRAPMCSAWGRRSTSALPAKRRFAAHRIWFLARPSRKIRGPLRQLNDRVPRDLETICAKAMAKELYRRYQTASEFADDLRRWLRGETIRSAARRKPGTRLAPGAGGGRWSRVWRRRYCSSSRPGSPAPSRNGAGRSERDRAEDERKTAQLDAQSLRASGRRNFRRGARRVDTYLTQVSDSDVLKAQNLEPLRRELLRTARDFYELRPAGSGRSEPPGRAR